MLEIYFIYESEGFYHRDKNINKFRARLESNSGKAYIIKTLLNYSLFSPYWENIGLVLFYFLFLKVILFFSKFMDRAFGSVHKLAKKLVFPSSSTA